MEGRHEQDQKDHVVIFSPNLQCQSLQLSQLSPNQAYWGVPVPSMLSAGRIMLGTKLRGNWSRGWKKRWMDVAKFQKLFHSLPKGSPTPQVRVFMMPRIDTLGWCRRQLKLRHYDTSSSKSLWKTNSRGFSFACNNTWKRWYQSNASFPGSTHLSTAPTSPRSSSPKRLLIFWVNNSTTGGPMTTT